MAQAGTLAAVVALGAAVAWRKPAAPPQPQETIYQLMDAARAGDTDRYLGQFTGALEAALRKSVAEQGGDAFARHLRETNAPIKGVAVVDVEPGGEDTAKLRVEYVYHDRNEAQIVHLVHVGKAWKIARMDNAARVQTLVPYGAPVQ